MTSYTNARPGAGLLVVDLDLGLRTPRVTVPRLADVARLAYQLVALGTRYPYGRWSDSGAPMNER